MFVNIYLWLLYNEETPVYILQTLIMTKEIQQSFQEILSMITWIDPITKKLASEKINAMLLRIGYPDYILNSEKLNERYKNVSS